MKPAQSHQFPNATCAVARIKTLLSAVNAGNARLRSENGTHASENRGLIQHSFRCESRDSSKERTFSISSPMKQDIRLLSLVVSVNVAGFGFTLAAHGQSGEALLQTLQREAPKAWEEYLSRCANMQGSWRGRMKTDGQVVSDHQAAITRNERSRLFVAKVIIGKSKSFVHCNNEKYAFDLVGARENEAWLLHEFYPRVREIPPALEREDDFRIA